MSCSRFPQVYLEDIVRLLPVRLPLRRVHKLVWLYVVQMSFVTTDTHPVNGIGF